MQLPVIGIDPGTEQSAFVRWDGKSVVECGIVPNEELLAKLSSSDPESGTPLYVEMIASYGMAVGKETFQTVLWIGRFVEDWHILGNPWHLIYRLQVKTYHCKSGRAKDANIRQALIDKYGQVGTKKNPGPLYGIKSHLWSALAVATYAVEAKIKPDCSVKSSS